MIFGIIIGLILNYLKQSKWFIYRWFSISWIEIARNTPALLQLFFFGFGLGAYGLHLDPLFIILLGLSFNNAGYLAETFRGGFEAIPKTQSRIVAACTANFTCSRQTSVEEEKLPQCGGCSILRVGVCGIRKRRPLCSEEGQHLQLLRAELEDFLLRTAGRQDTGDQPPSSHPGLSQQVSSKRA